MTQIHHKPGLGASKPPKKRKKEANPGAAKRPAALSCKKRKGSCNHEVVFGEHYSKSAWAEYAAFVKSKKSSIHIDPNYVFIVIYANIKLIVLGHTFNRNMTM